MGAPFSFACLPRAEPRPSRGATVVPTSRPRRLHCGLVHHDLPPTHIRNSLGPGPSPSSLLTKEAGRRQRSPRCPRCPRRGPCTSTGIIVDTAAIHTEEIVQRSPVESLPPHYVALDALWSALMDQGATRLHSTRYLAGAVDREGVDGAQVVP
ncbi:hypothetical protein DFJ74DRAFT_682288 [Hyaloraphidium curvatum]|nr:hypothetical protein DFJ74DRAFT_682288 [Hyaloraphidium curvatum]